MMVGNFRGRRCIACYITILDISPHQSFMLRSHFILSYDRRKKRHAYRRWRLGPPLYTFYTALLFSSSAFSLLPPPPGDREESIMSFSILAELFISFYLGKYVDDFAD